MMILDELFNKEFIFFTISADLFLDNYRFVDDNYIASITYTDFINYISSNFVVSEDQEYFLNSCEKSSIIDKYNNGDFSFTFDFKTIINDNISFTQVIIQSYLNQIGNISCLISFRDIDSFKKSQIKLKTMASTDYLTKLLNRASFIPNVEEVLRKNITSGLLLIDIDNFKMINDIYGHTKGDNLIKSVSDFLRNVEPSSLISRFGGDEFLIFIENSNYEDLKSRAINILNRFFSLYNKLFDKVSLSCSIGLSLSYNINSFDKLFNMADKALYNAKNLGKNTYAYIDSSNYYSDTNESLDLIHILDVIKNNELEVYFQPLVNPYTNKIVSFEALARYKDISTNLIVNSLEQNEVIDKLDKYVLEYVCKIISNYSLHGYDLTISINQSKINLRNKEYIKYIKDTVLKYNIDPHLIELEITESVFIAQRQLLFNHIKELKEFGFRIVLDDFGIGYSTLSVLSNMEIDSIKLDKTFLYELNKSKKSLIVLKNVINMCKELDLLIVFEGIEDESQLEIVKKLEVDLIQGYYFYKPLNLVEFENVVKNHNF